jgi:hypothetical protein
MPVSDAYFLKKDGTKAERNVFDYIRDHLGYRSELQTLETAAKWKKGEPNRIDISLINRGFSTLYNEHPVYIVLVDSLGKVCHTMLTEARVNDWQPYAPQDTSRTPLLHHIIADIALPETFSPGTYHLGLWIPDGSAKLMYNPAFAIRCANGDSSWEISPEGQGINRLMDITIK